MTQETRDDAPKPTLIVEVSPGFEKKFLDTAGGFNAPILIKRINPQSHQEESITTSPAQLLEALSTYLINLTMTMATVNQNVVATAQKLDEVMNALASTLESVQALVESVDRNSDAAEQQLEEDAGYAEPPQQMFAEPPPRRQSRARKGR